MNQHWPLFAAGLEPADALVGPFPREPFLTAWLETMSDGSPLTAGSGKGFIPLVEDSGDVTCAGQADLTDYHSPRGNDFETIVESLGEIRRSSTSLILDSLPEHSARLLHKLSEGAGLSVELSEETIGTMTIDVENDYLAGLGKKQRHEVRRKLRRYEESAGPADLEISKGPEPLERFIRLHRMAGGEKGEFFDPARVEFFGRLVEQNGWEFAELKSGSSVVASLFGFRESAAYYLYNSSFDPDYREVSPGIVGLYRVIEHVVESGCTRVDLLKGDEPYKFRMGAVRRPLFTLSFA